MSHKSKELSISSNAHVMIAVEEAKSAAKNLGFSDVDQAKIGIATSELARNIVVHAGGKGRIIINSISKPKVSIKVVAEDEGPGIIDVEKAIRGGYSTRGGLGEGLGAVKRLMDTFNIETKIGEGTKITAEKWKR